MASITEIPSPSSDRPNTQDPKPRAALKPQGNIVEYQVVNGLAVAFGDVILGKPTEPVPGGHGMTEILPPRLWDRPEIPYLIHPDLPNSERVEKALAYLREKTPVQFVAHQGENDAIVFEPGKEHCLSPVGRIGGLQPILLSSGCRWQDVLHEILHSLGFVHEQNRVDRDQYIEIVWDNIDEIHHVQFAMAPESFLDPVRGFPFDFESVMLYRADSFALKPGTPTMRPLSSQRINPTDSGLSEGDIRRLNRMFRGYE